MINAALNYAKRGGFVFPADANGGESYREHATNDLDRISKASANNSKWFADLKKGSGHGETVEIVDASTLPKTSTEIFFGKIFGVALEKNCGDINLRCIPRKKGNVVNHFVSSIEDATAKSIEYSSKQYDVYVSVNTHTGKSGAKDSVKFINTLHADIDYGQAGHKKKQKFSDYKEASTAIRNFKYPPSLVIHSGGGFHCYWVMDTPIPADNSGVDKIEDINKALAADLGADPGTHNIDRVLRVPNTFNYKLEDLKRPVKLLSATDNLYNPSNFNYKTADPDDDQDLNVTDMFANLEEAATPSEILTGKSEFTFPCLSEDILSLIRDGAVEGDRRYESRSEVDQAVITALLKAGASKDKIFEVFEEEAIGEKYHEHSSKKKYLEFSIASGKRYVIEEVKEALSSVTGELDAFFAVTKLRDSGFSRGVISALAPQFKSQIAQVFKVEKKSSIRVKLADKMRNASDIVEANIPPRRPILGNRFYIKYVTETVAEGGGSKSTLTMTESLAITSGVSITGMPIYEQGPTAIFNLEDPMDELERKISAIAKAFRISKNQMDGLILSSWYGSRFHLVVPDGRGDMIENHELIQDIIDFAIDNKLKLITIDPLVKCHGLNENDNMAMDRVMVVLSRIADIANCAISVVHHERKPPAGTSNQGGDISAGRGASSVGAAARVVNTLGIMTKKQAEKYQIPEDEKPWYVRLESAKGSFSAPQVHINWFKRDSVRLCQGDEVGILRPVELEEQVVKEDPQRWILDDVLDLPYETSVDQTISLTRAVKLISGKTKTTLKSVRASIDELTLLYGSEFERPHFNYKVYFDGTALKRIPKS